MVRWCCFCLTPSSDGGRHGLGDDEAADADDANIHNLRERHGWTLGMYWYLRSKHSSAAVDWWLGIGSLRRLLDNPLDASALLVLDELAVRNASVVHFLLPQLCHLMLSRPIHDTHLLTSLLLESCSLSLHSALLTYWNAFSICPDGPALSAGGAVVGSGDDGGSSGGGPSGGFGGVGGSNTIGGSITGVMGSHKAGQLRERCHAVMEAVQTSIVSFQRQRDDPSQVAMRRLRRSGKELVRRLSVAAGHMHSGAGGAAASGLIRRGRDVKGQQGGGKAKKHTLEPILTRRGGGVARMEGRSSLPQSTAAEYDESHQPRHQLQRASDTQRDGTPRLPASPALSGVAGDGIEMMRVQVNGDISGVDDEQRIGYFDDQNQHRHTFLLTPPPQSLPWPSSAPAGDAGGVGNVELFFLDRSNNTIPGELNSAVSQPSILDVTPRELSFAFDESDTKGEPFNPAATAVATTTATMTDDTTGLAATGIAQQPAAVFTPSSIPKERGGAFEAGGSDGASDGRGGDSIYAMDPPSGGYASHLGGSPSPLLRPQPPTLMSDVIDEMEPVMLNLPPSGDIDTAAVGNVVTVSTIESTGGGLNDREDMGAVEDGPSSLRTGDALDGHGRRSRAEGKRSWRAGGGGTSGQRMQDIRNKAAAMKLLADLFEAQLWLAAQLTDVASRAKAVSVGAERKHMVTAEIERISREVADFNDKLGVSSLYLPLFHCEAPRSDSQRRSSQWAGVGKGGGGGSASGGMGGKRRRRRERARSSGGSSIVGGLPGVLLPSSSKWRKSSSAPQSTSAIGGTGESAAAMSGAAYSASFKTTNVARQHALLRFIPESVHVFNTKKRAPFLVVCEVVERHAVGSAAGVHPSGSSVSRSRRSRTRRRGDEGSNRRRLSAGSIDNEFAAEEAAFFGQFDEGQDDLEGLAGGSNSDGIGNHDEEENPNSDGWWSMQQGRGGRGDSDGASALPRHKRSSSTRNHRSLTASSAAANFLSPALQQLSVHVTDLQAFFRHHMQDDAGGEGRARRLTGRRRGKSHGIGVFRERRPVVHSEGAESAGIGDGCGSAGEHLPVLRKTRSMRRNGYEKEVIHTSRHTSMSSSGENFMVAATAAEAATTPGNGEASQEGQLSVHLGDDSRGEVEGKDLDDDTIGEGENGGCLPTSSDGANGDVGGDLREASGGTDDHDERFLDARNSRGESGGYTCSDGDADSGIMAAERAGRRRRATSGRRNDEAEVDERGGDADESVATMTTTDVGGFEDTPGIGTEAGDGETSGWTSQAERRPFQPSNSSAASLAAHGRGGALVATSAGRKGKKLLNEVFGLAWTKRKDAFRRSSPYGKLRGWNALPCIVKANDDLRQEELAYQLISMIDRFFTAAGLPLQLFPYRVSVVSPDAGLVEVVPDSTSLDALKGAAPEFNSLGDFFYAAYGLEGSSALETARNNFIESLAAYCIVCYLLNIKDRHNGNLLLTRAGHLVHIDFGFLLGQSPGGRVKPTGGWETAPFKLTREFVAVMGGYSSPGFARFRSLCVDAFLCARKNRNKLLVLVEALASGNPACRLPCLQQARTAIDGLRSRFHEKLSKRECINLVHKLIKQSAESWSTQTYDNFQALTVGIRK